MAMFGPGECSSLSIASSWKSQCHSAEIDCQTDDRMWTFSEKETQSGLKTSVRQFQVTAAHAGDALLPYLNCMDARFDWRGAIEGGRMTVDCEVVSTCDMLLEEHCFVELVDCSKDAGTQTHAEPHEESKDEDDALVRFLRRVAPSVERELELNLVSKAFDNDALTSHSGAENDNVFWHTLSVDLVKRKVVFADWGRGPHVGGAITRCSITRTGERVYDVEFEDGGKQFAVKEAYIRVPVAGQRKDRSPAASLLRDDVRVHAKSGKLYLPGRIKRASNGAYDVELDGGKVEKGLSAEDLLAGLNEGLAVEARRPYLPKLECTALCWSCTGGAVAVAFGQTDASGWGTCTGAVCVWSVFGRAFSPDSPDYVLDHSSSIGAIAYHPEMPGLLAAGSLDGQVLIFDLTSAAPEQPICVSPISELASKEPIVSMQWVWDAALTMFLIASLSSDGRLLFWSTSNDCKLPLKGCALNTKGVRKYPSSHGGASLAFSGGSGRRTQWAIAATEGGAILRAQVSKLLSGPAFTDDSARDTLPSFRRSDDGTFRFEGHIGATRLAFSPFHRSLFLSAGADGVLKLFHVLGAKPLREWEPAGRAVLVGISAVSFSPARPTVFAVAVGSSILLYDLSQSLTSHVLKLEPPSTSVGKHKERSTISDLVFNTKQRDMLAACDSSGRTYVWRLGWALTTRRRGDQETVDAIAGENA